MQSESINKSNTGGLNFILRSFHYRNYRLFFSGQAISLVGTWIQNLTISWLAYRLTNSAFLMGIVGFSSQIPIFILTPFAGVMADRWHRRYVLLATQILSMIQALILAFLVLTGLITIWHVIPLSIFLGLINAFDAPTRQSFVFEIIEKKEDFGNAIALNSSMFNGARLIGPTIAGILIAAYGEGICFLLNGLSYVAVISALMAMRITPKQFNSTRENNILRGLKEGFAYVYRTVNIRAVLLFLSFSGLLGIPYMVLLPIMAKDVLHGGPHTLGFLMGASGIGALLGAVFLASRKNPAKLIRIIPIAAAVFGSALVAVSLSRLLYLSLFIMIFTGFGMMVLISSSNTVLQTVVEDDKRGRVMSLYAMAFMGMAPFGSLLAGSLASKIGAPYTILLGGLSVALGAIVFFIRLPRYEKGQN